MIKTVIASEYERRVRSRLNLLIGCLILMSGCKDPGTQPKTHAQIMTVEIAVKHVTANYATKFVVVLQDSLEEDQRIAWRFQQPDGSYSDSLTETTTFFWVAPDQPGQYKHNLWIETGEGEVISEVHSFMVSVSPWQPPPSDTTLTGKIVFSANEGGTNQIFTMEADRSNVQKITNFASGEDAFGVSWSPDGEQIVYASAKYGTTAGPALWVMNADGSDKRLLQPGNPFPLLGNWPKWSPDGSKIVYYLCASCVGGRLTDIYIYDVDTREVSYLNDHPGHDQFPALSPDSYRIVFSSNRNYIHADSKTYRTDLYTMNVDGSGLKRLTHNGCFSFPVWGPDGVTIAFRSADASLRGLYTMNIQNGVFKKIAEDSSEFIRFYPLVWSPDGNYLLISGKQELYIFDTQTHNLDKVHEASSQIFGADWFVPIEN